MLRIYFSSIVLVVLSGFITHCGAQDSRPLMEQYLHSGQLRQGEMALESQLQKNPKDDQARFGLGLIRIVRAVETMGQSFYQVGLKPTSNWVPFVRLPIPHNPEPNPVSYLSFRRILDQFTTDMAQAEATLAAITDDEVKLPLRLAHIKIDLDGDGQATDQFLEMLNKLMGAPPELLKANPEFLVHFDRGDVAWLRAYCHLLGAMLEIYLSVDTEADFYFFAKEHFPRVKPFLTADEENRLRGKQMMQTFSIQFKEPKRLSRFRHHLLDVAKLNRETWRYIRAETDDQYEWLPNAKQKGVFNLPVRDEMITTWLTMMGELESMLEGKSLIPMDFFGNTRGKGLNVKTLLEDPPQSIDFNSVMQQGPAAKYLETGTNMNFEGISAVMRAFDNPMRMGYFAWFN
ncbi:MAG: hypothetical protein JNJ77_20760 [Planctomycetia bacterium]|nr:hypothetical protein [Planctomycetia bacterium]